VIKMSGVKGWKKATDYKDLIVYKNEKNGIYIRISHKLTWHHKFVQSMMWHVTYGKIGRYGVLGIHKWVKVFDNKEEALRFAINWMKKHPNG